MDSTDPAMVAPNKKELRKKILALRAALTEQQVRERSEVICRRICGMDVYAKTRDICIYMPIRNEVDVTALIEPARRDGKGIWIPRVTGEEMIFNRYDEDMLEPSEPYGILESASETVLEADEKTLIIMPGAVFDRIGNRIGYGGGYYDRYLQKHPCCHTIAACYELQIVDSIPAEDHDIRPDAIVTEDQTVERTEKRSRP